MKTGLEEVEALVDSLVGKYLNDTDTDYSITLCNQLNHEVKLLRKVWTQQIFSLTRDHLVLRYVRYLQAGLTSLSDRIACKLAATGTKYLRNKAVGLEPIQTVLLEFEHLLQFLYDYYHRYFDSDHRLPIFTVNRRLQDLKTNFESLHVLLSSSHIDKELREVIVNSIDIKLKNARSDGLSYRDIEMIISLFGHLDQLIADHNNTEHVAVELVRLRFNTTSFIDWYQQYLINQVSKCPGRVAKKNFLTEHLRGIRVVSGNGGYGFDPIQPAAGGEMSLWLQKLLTDDDSQHKKPYSKANGIRKLRLTLSVAQLALWVKLFYLESTYATQNISELIRFFTYSFETKKQSQISLKSFSRAFYSSDQSTAAGVRAVLQRMIKHIDVTYFPS